MKLKGQGWMVGEGSQRTPHHLSHYSQNSGKIEGDPKASFSSSQTKVFQFKKEWRRRKPTTLWVKLERKDARRELSEQGS